MSFAGEHQLFRHFNLRILQCDDQLRSDKKVTNARELAEYMEHFELIGQSATDFVRFSSTLTA